MCLYSGFKKRSGLRLFCCQAKVFFLFRPVFKSESGYNAEARQVL